MCAGERAVYTRALRGLYNIVYYIEEESSKKKCSGFYWFSQQSDSTRVSKYKT